MKYCPYCGEPLTAHDYLFCPECGARLGQGEPRSEKAQEFPPQERVAFPAESENLEELFAERDRMEAPREERLEQISAAVAQITAEEPDSTGEIPKIVPEVLSEQEAAEAFLRPDGWSPEEETRFVEAPDSRYQVKKQKPAKTKQKRASVHVLPIFLAVVLVLGLGAGYVVLKLRQSGAAEREAERFARSLYAGSVSLTDLETAGSGLTPGAANDIAEMSRTIKRSVSEQQFKAHLLAMGDPAAPGYDEALSSFTFKQTKDTLLEQRFKVRVTAVPVLVKTAIVDATLYVDEKRVDAKPAEGGLALELSPGTHELRAVYEGYGTEYELGSAEVSSLSARQIQEVALTQKTAEVTIELAGVETDLKIKVDGRDVTPKDARGWVVLSPAFVGMDIEVSCAEYAQSFEVATPGKVTLAVDYIGILEEKNPGGRANHPELLTNRQLVDKLGKRFYTCYRSYLEASNRGDETLIRDADEDYAKALAQNMNDYNKGYQFEFKSVEVDRRSISRFEEEGELFAVVRVEVRYHYAKKADQPNWMAGFNRQDVTLRWDKETEDWLVYGSRVNDELEMSEDTFTVT